jgi:hypothetical protein
LGWRPVAHTSASTSRLPAVLAVDEHAAVGLAPQRARRVPKRSAMPSSCICAASSSRSMASKGRSRRSPRTSMETSLPRPLNTPASSTAM